MFCLVHAIIFITGGFTMANNICVDEQVFKQIERATERMGSMLEMSKELKFSVKAAMNECGLRNHLYDVKDDCKKTVLYFEGIMSKEDREALLDKLAEKTGKLPDNYQIVAFYY